MKQFYIQKFISKYKNLVSSGDGISDKNYKRGDIAYWRDALFISLLHYCLPISLLTGLTGILMITNEHSTTSVVLESFVFCSLIIVTFARFLKLHWRKFILVSIFYILSIYQISVMGYQGAGMFYLLVITVLIALILPIRFAYWSIVFTAFIIGAVAVEQYVMLKGRTGSDRYHINQILIFSLPLIFSQLTVISLIDKIFNRLQITIYTKDKLRENYVRIFDSSPIPMWVFDIDTLHFLAVNETAISQYGYTKSEFMALTIQDLRPKDHQRALGELVNYNKDQIKFRKDHVMHLTKDGEILFVDIESRLLTYKGRNAKLVLATNITDKVKAREENYQSMLKIKQSEANLQAIFNSTSEGFLLLDENYKIISFNEKAAKAVFLNKNNSSFKAGHSIFEFVEESRQAALKNYLKQADQGSLVEYELDFMIEGRQLCMHYTIMLVYQDGIKKGICINGRDITDDKTYVQTIERQNAKLREISWTQSHMVRAPLARIMALHPLMRAADNLADLENLLTYLERSCDELDTVVRKIVIETENFKQ